MGRAHGLNGQLVVQLVTNRQGRLAEGSRVQCRERELVVAAARPLPGAAHGPASAWLVTFEGVGSRQEAEALRGAPLSAPAPGPDDGLWVHELIGAEVSEADGTERGTVTAVQANPASDLLVLDNGALVPLHFVVSCEQGRIVVDAPPGLFEL